MYISTFFGLNTAMSALDTAQLAENVIGNNIANANTPGYTQETAVVGEFGAFPNVPANDAAPLPGQFGEGATVTTVQRQTSAFFNHQDRANQGVYQMYNTLNNSLQQIEGIVNEPSSQSVQNALDQFFSSFQTLSTDPSDTAAKQSTVTQAQTLAQTFQTVVTGLGNLEGNLTASAANGGVIDGQIRELNQYAAQVAQLNGQIANVQASGESPNALEDQRGQLLDKMSRLANITYTQQPNGMDSITIQAPAGSGLTSQTLVNGQSATTFANTPANLQLITSGSIAGNVQAADTLNRQLSYFSGLMAQFATAVNAYEPGMFQVATGQTATNATTGAAQTYQYLTVPASFGAANVVAGTNGPGDNSTALQVANLQNDATQSFSYTYYQMQSASTQTGSFTGTFDQALAGLVSALGTQTAGVQSNLKTANAQMQQSDQMRQSISGVDINQQATLMVQYQNAYSAAAKFMGVYNSMLQTLIGIVP